jgi:hypothetical protein
MREIDPKQAVRLVVKDRQASARLSRVLGKPLEESVGQAALERPAAGRANAQTVSFGGIRPERLALKDLDRDAGIF